MVLLAQPSNYRLNKRSRFSLDLLRAYVLGEASHLGVTGSPKLWDESSRLKHATPSLNQYTFGKEEVGPFYGINAAGPRTEYATTGVFLGGLPCNFSTAIVCKPTLTLAVETILGYWYVGGGSGPGAADFLYILYITSTGAVVSGTQTASGFTYSISATGVIQADKWCVLGVSVAMGGRQRVYYNGARVADIAQPSASFVTPIHATLAELTLGNDTPGWISTGPFVGKLAATYMWNRPLSDSDHIALTSDPWQFIRRRSHSKTKIADGFPKALSPGPLPVGDPTAPSSQLIPPDSVKRKRKQQKLINPNPSSMFKGDEKEQLREIKRNLADALTAIRELQLIQFAARVTEPDKLPCHGELCEILDGQYLRIISIGSNRGFEVKHGLGRVPQGMIWLYHRLNEAQVLIEGSVGFVSPSATKEAVYFFHPGPANALSVGILI